MFTAARQVVSQLFSNASLDVSKSKVVSINDEQDVTVRAGRTVNNFDAIATLSVEFEIRLEVVLRGLVHECALNAIESGTSEFMAELRTITCLFVEVIIIAFIDTSVKS